MKLKRLILHNYKQHIDREQVFEGHFIGVVGRNGSGKSNLLGSLNFAMGGEQPGFKKQDLLRWGADDGHVILEFEHNGVQGRIYRELHSSRAEFKYGDESYTTATAVAAGIGAHLGLDKDILKQTIFVRQAEIDSILFEDPRIRQLAFQKLCGIGDAAKIHKKLGEEIAGLNVPPDYGEQIAEGKVRYAEMETRLNQLQSTLTASRSQRETCPPVAVLQTQLGTYAAMRGNVQRLMTIINEHAEYTTRLANARAELEALNVPEGDVNSIDMQLTAKQQQLVLSQDYTRARTAWESAGKQLIELGDPPVPNAVPFTDDQLAQLKVAADDQAASMSSVRSDIKMYSELEATVGNLQEAACPVCGTQMKDTAHVQTQLVKLRERMVQLQADTAQQVYADSLNKALAVKQGNTMAVQNYGIRHEALERTFVQAKTALQACKPVEQAPEAIIVEIADMTAKRQQVMAALTQHSRLGSDIRNCEEQQGKLASEKQVLEARVAEVPDIQNAAGVAGAAGGAWAAQTLIEQRVVELSAQITELQSLDQQLAQLSGMVNELSTSMKQLADTLATLEGKRANQGSYKQVLDTLTRVRDWFHYNNGPNTLANAVLNSMNEDINEFLGQFTAPFSVVQSEDALGFKCYFHDGRDMPSDGPPDAYHLSGGQRIQLAIAFRFASYCMFANKLGLLSLDEPTVHLDEYNVGAFCTLISKIREVAKKMDLQVLIATHEPAVIPFMDTVIEVG